MVLKRMNKWYCLFLVSVVLFSCSADEPFGEKDKEIEESGETVRVSFSASAAEMDLVGDPLPTDKTRAAIDESCIYSAHMYQFNGTTDASTLTKNCAAISISGSKLVFDLNLAASASANRVYLVANVAGITLPAVTEGSTTLADFKKLLLTFTDGSICNGSFSDGLFIGGIPMIGYKDITPATLTENDLSFSLTRMAAKVTVTISSSLVDFSPYSVQIKNVVVSGQYDSPGGVFPDNAVSTNFADYALAYCGSKRTFSWYIPENKRGTVDGIAYAINKGPSNAPVNSTYIEFLCNVPSNGGLAYYRIYPGANSTTDFNVTRNTHYNLSVSVSGTNLLDNRIERPEANCYAVVPGKTVNIPVSRAITYHDDLSGTSQFTVVKLWDDAGVISDFTASVLGQHEIAVKTNSGISGNAVIAIKDASNAIRWSWHVWVTDYNPWGGATITNTYNTNNRGSNFVFMDRNLGATEVANLANPSGIGTGLFYQWGRKDPFPASKSYDEDQAGGGKFTRILTTDPSIGAGDASIGYAIQNPSVFIYAPNTPYDWYNSAGVNPADRNNTLWGHNTTKSVYDPCPVGWRVPSHYGGDYASVATSPWYGFATGGNVHIDSQVFNKGYSWGVNIYPAAGARAHGSGSIVNPSTNGYYWSASPYGSTSVSASRLYIYSGSVYVHNNSSRAGGFSVRCVRE